MGRKFVTYWTQAPQIKHVRLKRQRFRLNSCVLSLCDDLVSSSVCR